MEEPRQALAGTLALLAITVGTLFGLALLEDGSGRSSSIPDQREAAAPALDPERLLELGVERTPAVARRVEAIRGLRFARTPEPQLSDVAELRRLAARALDKPRLRRELALSTVELRLLGLLERDADLGEVASDVTAQTVAYYHVRRDELFLVGDAVPAGPDLAEFILAHELTHALEDQRFGLTEGVGVSDDRALAEDAFSEGTATAVMTRYANRHLDPFALASEASALDAGATGELPRFAEAEVDFVYTEGTDFVEELLALGKDWGLVDFAFEKRLPATTEQILHLEKFLDDERGLPVEQPRSPGEGWRALDSGTAGEFATREILSAGESEADAEDAAAGWGGDRYRLFARGPGRPRCDRTCRGDYTLTFNWRGDDRDEAIELAIALREYVSGGLGGTASGARSWDLEQGAAAIDISGDKVGLGLAPNVAMARRIAAQRR